MAGIAGIISKTNNSHENVFSDVLEKMYAKLSFSKKQLGEKYNKGPYYFCNVIPVSSKINNHFQHNKLLNIFCAFDGLIYIDEHEKKHIRDKYNLISAKTDYEFIPYLYDYYKAEFVHHITGWFNLFLVHVDKQEALLVNDRLGYLPLYYYESDEFFMFASKIECLLASNLLGKIEFDKTTIAEYLYFNYPLSDYTYIKKIQTLANAVILHQKSSTISTNKYWSTNELFGYSPVGKKDSIALINTGLQRAMDKITTQSNKKLNVTLTGGWDSRVVLSKLLPDQSKKLNLYSFGAEDADDILIPKHIAKKEHLKYTSYVLDQAYLDNDFLIHAKRTIELSNGTRNYKRTHYLYAIQKIALFSDMLISGIFGDEIFKVGKPSGGAVLSQNAINCLTSNFNIKETLSDFSKSQFWEYLNGDKKKICSEMKERLITLKSNFSKFNSIEEKYFAFRFELNLRKYFGNEVNSYNDFVYCFSPFIDYDFLENFARTQYFGIHYPFDANSIRLKKQSTQLYHDIVHANYPSLTTYNSARGYSMKDATTLPGNLKILYQKYFKNRKGVDGFNTKPTDRLFRTLLKTKQITSETLKMPDNNLGGFNHSDLLSLIYWLGMVEKKYVR